MAQTHHLHKLKENALTITKAMCLNNAILYQIQWAFVNVGVQKKHSYVLNTM